MSDFNLGTVTAYGYAKDKGYTGTEDEFAALMASYADVAEQAAESATQAAASATTASTKASEAAASATAAASSKTAAETAQGGAETAAQTATTKAGEASASATTASGKATEATTAAGTATTKASEATTAATTATTKAGEASTSATNAAASATRAQEILDSIPEDYSQLSDDVSDLKDGLSSIATVEDVVKVNLVYEIIADSYLVVSGTTFFTRSNTSYDIVRIALPESGRVSLNFIPSYTFGFLADENRAYLGKLTANNLINSTNYIYGNFDSSVKYLFLCIANDQKDNGYIALDVDYSVYDPLLTCSVRTPSETIIDNTVVTPTDEMINGICEEINAQKVFYCGSTREYTTIVSAVQEAVKQANSIVYVDDGVYDLYDEFGADYFANYSYASNGGGLQLYNGIRLIFSANSKVVFNYTGSNTEVMKDFSPFNAKYNSGGYTIENATIECSNCRYCIHDEHAGDANYYETHIIRCNLYMDNTSNTAFSNYYCIGGGLGGCGIVELRDSIINTVLPQGVTRYEPVYWHNHDRASIRSYVVITGNYFVNDKTSVTVTYRGSSTDVTDVLISNNSLGLAVGIPSGDHNVKMRVFNNEVRTA